MFDHLREKAAKALHDARAILSAADTEGRALSTDEQQKYDLFMAEFDATREQVKRAERLEAAESAIESAGPRAGRDAETAAEQRVTNSTATPEYRDAFWRAVKSGDFAREMRALSVGTDTAGGFTVPDEFRRELVSIMTLDAVMRPISTVIQSNSGTLSIPVNSAHGVGYWKGEGVAYVDSDETFAEVTLTPYKATTLIKVSEELLNDSAFDIQSFLAREFGRRISALEETAFVAGTGSGQPTGVVGGSTLGTTASATNAITANELMDLQYALARQYRRNARWMMHDSTVKAIRKLVTGVSGDKTYLWAPGLAANEPDRLLGYPVVVSNDMGEIATGVKVALFGDFSYYYIAERQQISMQVLRELYAGNGQVGFRIFRRVDGELTLATAVYHLIMA